MNTGRTRALTALAVFAGWVLVTVFFARIWGGDLVPQSINESISGSLQPGILAAGIFLIVCVVALRWGDVGFTSPHAHSLRVLWFPALYVIAFSVLAIAVGLPPPDVTLLILANTLLAGFSEEVACRGVLFSGLRHWMSIWPAMLLSTLLFGAAHILNGIATGSFLLAGIQAVAAFMTGMAFMAIRVRTGSLYPGIILHALWDFTLLLSVTGLIQRFGMPDVGAADFSGPAAAALALPILLVVPNFVYGLFLLRRSARDPLA